MVVAGGLALACAAPIACSGSPQSAPPPAADVGVATRSYTGADVAQPSDQPCEDWSTIDCGIELKTHGGLIDCARGVRVCQDGHYGACVADASLGVVSVQAPEAVLPETIHTGTLAVGGVSAACADDPCNPYCQRYLDQPPAPVQARSALR